MLIFAPEIALRVERSYSSAKFLFYRPLFKCPLQVYSASPQLRKYLTVIWERPGGAQTRYSTDTNWIFGFQSPF